MTENDHSRYEVKYRAYYDAGVDFVFTKGFDDEYRQFLECRPTRGKLVECGCGEGFAAAMAAQIGYEVLGIDSAPSAVEKARATHVSPRLRFVVGDVCHLDFIDPGSVDLVADVGCMHMIGDSEDARSYLAHVHRILRPGGQVYWQNGVSPATARAWHPAMSAWISEWEARIAARPQTVHEVFEVSGERIEIDVPKQLGGVFRDLDEQVNLLTSAGFTVTSAHVKTPGVNSPFEAVIIGEKQAGGHSVPCR